jgi:hypothetical protein
MRRRTFLKAIGTAALLPILPRGLSAATTTQKLIRRRPADASWPSKSAWKRLNDAVGGNLVPVDFPLSVLKSDRDGAAAKELLANLKNPYHINEQAGLTQSLGWIDAWKTSPSVYAVAARNANHVAAAAMHNAFVPSGCEHKMQPQPAVTFGTGIIGMQAYDAVTTKAGKYIQGGGCLTVGLAGLIQGGGFGSHSKRYGTAAGSLLEVEVVTADGQIRIANACTNPDLFWALKGGGGGTFGVVSRMTARAHELPEFFGAANITITASSDDAYRGLIRDIFAFYRDHLFNEHWGEQIHVKPNNTLEVKMNSAGLSTEQARQIWQPFLDSVKHSSRCSIKGVTSIGSIPARHWWDPQWWKKHWPEIAFPRNSAMHAIIDDTLLHVMNQPVFKFDPRPGAGPKSAWWIGNTGEV